jgi:RimJ/RimL family protein N-acetyltransferase
LLVHDVDADHRRCELGIWIVPAERGTGLGRAALALVSRWLLTECGLTRVQLLTAPDNEALIRAASAAGFVGEGLLRGYLRGPGGRFDVRVLSLVASDLGAAA